MPFNLPFSSIKEFSIVDLIHEGPYTLVYRGYQTSLKRDVLIKLLKPSGSSDLKKRFEREARVYARLNHPNIVSVFDFGEQEKFLYIILEYVHGTSLKSLLEKSPNLPEDIILKIGTAVLSALEHASQKKVVHRDIKPGNILIDSDGRVKVADFGLALIGDEPNLTQQQAMIGTPAYMAPEQITGDQIDQRSDLFSFGATLYELLFGEQAFGSDNYSTCINNILNETPKKIREQNSKISAGLFTFMERCLQKQKAQRFETVSAALAQWQKIYVGQVSPANFLAAIVKENSPSEILAKPVINSEKPKGNVLKRWFLFSVLLIFILVGWWFVSINREARPVKKTGQDVLQEEQTESDGKLSEPVLEKPDTSRSEPKPAKKEVGQELKTNRNEEKITPIKKEEKEAPPLAMAKMDLVVTPWAAVYLDEALIDSHLTNKQIDLSAGTHILTFKHPRFSPESQTINFKPSELTQVQWSFWAKTGFLNLEVRPWAHVYINDEFYDTTPINKPIRIPAGQKVLELRHPSMRSHREIIEIKAGDTLNLKIALKIKSGTEIDK